MSGKSYLFGLLLMIGCLFTAAPSMLSPSAQAARGEVTSGCPYLVVIDVHGSGARANQLSAPGAKLGSKLQEVLKNKEVEIEPTPFQAAGGPITLVGAALKLPLGYHSSVVRTKRWLRKRLEELRRDCETTKVLLTGYSQGAQVAGDVYQERSRSQVVGAVLFGDPYYNHADSSNRFGLNIRPKQRIRTKLNGALAAPRPRPSFNSKRVLSFCHQFDPVCQAPLTRKELVHFRTSQHNNYTKFGEPEAAAVYFAKMLPAGSGRKTPVSKWPTKRDDGPTAFLMYLGASFIFPEWTSCNRSYCLAGTRSTVYVFSIKDGIDLIGTAPTVAEPRKTLRSLGMPSSDIDELLRE